MSPRWFFASVHFPHYHSLCGVMVDRETLLGLRTELRLDALFFILIDFSGIRIHDSLRANHVC